MTEARDDNTRPVLALSGGVGGAKLALGLSRVLKPGALTVVANTGDDFEHLGLHISPDIDTLTYTLADVDNSQTGWGRDDETWSFMAALGELGGETWFKLGDRDLAVHVERTRRRKAGETLSAITAGIAASFGVAGRILPMTDDRVRTLVQTRDGSLEFQRYFVEARCVPEVTGFVFDGAERARPQADILAMLGDPQLRAVVICPSNPYISIDPILAMPELRAALASSAAPVIAVSPIIGGKAVKGPTAKMMAELGRTVDVLTVAEHYRDLIDGFIVATADAPEASRLDMPVLARPVLMQSLADREDLAKAVLQFADRLACAADRPTRWSAR
jgi:LPPG:FO 2-phospho-L-lactate transferase